MTPITKKSPNAHIKVLPDAVAAKIAAGEVVERPASVLKELIENALDAGAGKIRVWVEKAGRKLIRVTDDGCGMTPVDLRASVERHATSKIGSLEDLERLRTYGFRGEALYALAAVSRLSITSHVRGAEEGRKIEIEGGRLISDSPAPPIPGTTVEVKNLFFNTPARAKFLKSDGTERSHLTEIVEEAALAHPQITFGYTMEGADIFHLVGKPIRNPAADYLARAQAVLGKEIFNPIPFLARRGELEIIAYIAPPDGVGYTRNMQHWFVNARPVVSRTLQQALYKAYEPYRSMNQHPYCAVFLTLPPSSYDVNVHPAKREIRFNNERDLYDTLYTAFSKALVAAKPVPSVLGRPAVVETTPAVAEPASRAQAQPIPEMPSLPRASGADAVREKAPAYSNGSTSLSPQSPLSGALFNIPETRGLSVRYLGQIEKTYLLFEDSGGLLVLDQHAAAERVLYEQFLSDIDHGKVRTQAMMLPVSVELKPSDAQKAEGYSEEFRALGYELQRAGKGTVLVSTMPSAFEMNAQDLKQLFEQLLEELPQSPTGGREKLRDIIAHRACRKALKAHESLTPEAALRLLSDLRRCDDPTCCPHGRPATIALTRSELARRFKRPGPPPL